MLSKLPSFEFEGKLWTIDVRLREFRFMVYGEVPEFVPFDSTDGERLLSAWYTNSYREEPPNP